MNPRLQYKYAVEKPLPTPTLTHLLSSSNHHNIIMDLTKKKNRKKMAASMLEAHAGDTCRWTVLPASTQDRKAAYKSSQDLKLGTPLDVMEYSQMRYVGLSKYDGLHSWARSVEGGLAVIVPWSQQTGSASLLESWAAGGQTSSAEAGWIPGFAGVGSNAPVQQVFQDMTSATQYDIAVAHLGAEGIKKAFKTPSQCKLTSVRVILVAWPERVTTSKRGAAYEDPTVAQAVQGLWARVKTLLSPEETVCVVPPLDHGHPAHAFLRYGCRVLRSLYSTVRTDVVLHVRIPPGVQKGLAITLPKASSGPNVPQAAPLPGHASKSGFTPPTLKQAQEAVADAAGTGGGGEEEPEAEEEQEEEEEAEEEPEPVEEEQEEGEEARSPSLGAEEDDDVALDLEGEEVQEGEEQEEEEREEEEQEVEAEAEEDEAEAEAEEEVIEAEAEEVEAEEEEVKEAEAEAEEEEVEVEPEPEPEPEVEVVSLPVVTCAYVPGAAGPTIEGGDMLPYWHLDSIEFQRWVASCAVEDMETVAPRTRKIELETEAPDVVLRSILRHNPAYRNPERWREFLMRTVSAWFSAHRQAGDGIVQYPYLPAWLDVFAGILHPSDLSVCAGSHTSVEEN